LLLNRDDSRVQRRLWDRPGPIWSDWLRPGEG